MNKSDWVTLLQVRLVKSAGSVRCLFESAEQATCFQSIAETVAIQSTGPVSQSNRQQEKTACQNPAQRLTFPNEI